MPTNEDETKYKKTKISRIPDKEITEALITIE